MKIRTKKIRPIAQGLESWQRFRDPTKPFVWLAWWYMITETLALFSTFPRSLTYFVKHDSTKTACSLATILTWSRPYVTKTVMHHALGCILTKLPRFWIYVALATFNMHDHDKPTKIHISEQRALQTKIDCSIKNQKLQTNLMFP